jgi:tetratricopeptide (TPR) repeat protein
MQQIHANIDHGRGRIIMGRVLAAFLALALLCPLPAGAVDTGACQSISGRLKALIKGRVPAPVAKFLAVSTTYRLVGAKMEDYQAACAGADAFFQRATETYEVERRWVYECNGTITTIGKQKFDRTNFSKRAPVLLDSYWQDKAEICARTRGDDYDAMAADYSEAIGKDPNGAEAYSGRAYAKLQKRDYDGAIADASAALRVKAEDTRALTVRAQLLEARNDFKGAIPDRLALTQLKRTSGEAYNDLCWARAVTGIDLKLAVKDCARALYWKNDFGAAFNSQGLVYLKLGEFPMAIEDYTAAIKIDANDANSLYGRGLAKQKNGDRAGGDADIAAAVKLSPNVGADYDSYNIQAALKAVPSITADCAGAKAHWQGVTAIDIVAGYEEHLAKFGSCNFAAKAKARIEELRKADKGG